MSEALSHLMADKNWGYIWPCYALAVLAFGGLAVRAVLQLRQWSARAKALDTTRPN